MPDISDLPPLSQHGGRRVGAGRPRKGQVRQAKTSSTLKSAPDRSGYFLRRLIRDAETGGKDVQTLLEGVRSGAISEYTAAIEMSYARRKERRGNGLGHGNQERTRDWKLYRLFYPRPQRDFDGVK
jgi:hypothetical protein